MSPQHHGAETEVADEKQRRARLQAVLSSYESKWETAKGSQGVCGGTLRPTDPFLSPFHFTAVTPFVSLLSDLLTIRTAGIGTLRDTQRDLANA